MNEMTQQRALMFALMFLCCLSLTAKVQAEVIPADVLAALSQREAALSDTTFIWTDESKVHYIARPRPSASQVNQMVLEMKHVMSKENIAKSAVARLALQNVENCLRTPPDTHTLNDVSVARLGSSTLVSGNYPLSQNPRMYFQQLYKGSDGLIVNEPDPSTPKFGYLPPFAYVASGDAVRCYVPATLSLELSPEDLALLSGFDPTKIGGTTWKFSGGGTGPTVLLGHRDQGPNDNNQNIRIALDPERNYAISQIDISYTDVPMSISYKCSDFQQVGQAWVPQRISENESASGVDYGSDTFNLTSTSTTKSISVVVPSNNSTVLDARLLGPVNTQELLAAMKEQSSQVVQYSWNASLPTMDELTRMHDQQHPGEATPDPAHRRPASQQ